MVKSTRQINNVKVWLAGLKKWLVLLQWFHAMISVVIVVNEVINLVSSISMIIGVY